MGLPLQVGFAPLNVELGVLLNPGMVRSRVVGDEVHNELETPGLETFLQTQEVQLLAEITVQGVAP